MKALDRRAQARVLRALHTQPPLVLPNAWDPGSAAAIEAAGAKAIATTSAGVSWAAGVADGGGLGRAALGALRRIVAAVSVPVTADIESGYGATPEEVGVTITEVLAAGAVGVNLEDSPGARGAPLLEPGTTGGAARFRPGGRTGRGHRALRGCPDGHLSRRGRHGEPASSATMVRAERYAAGRRRRLSRARRGRSEGDTNARQRATADQRDGVPGCADRRRARGARCRAHQRRLGRRPGGLRPSRTARPRLCGCAPPAPSGVMASGNSTDLLR